MNTLFSLIWLIIFVALVICGYRYVRYREKSCRVAFWSCACILFIMSILEPAPLEFTESEQKAFVSTLKETSAELKKYSEIDEVYFSDIKAAEELEIKLVVNDTASEKFLLEINDEARRIFLHALIDYWENLSNIPIDRIKIKIKIVPKGKLPVAPVA